MNIQKIQSFLSPLLVPISWGYAAAMRKRRARYARLPTLAYTAPQPCISVGNISWGGTGKTPFVAWLLAWAEQKKLRAAVLTRGYGGNPPHSPFVVTATTPAHEAGDEPLLLAKNFPAAHIIVDHKRAQGARYANQHFNPNVFFLDDGMQHLAMHRDIDLVLLHEHDLHNQWNTVIPAGSWREGATALHTAHAFFIRTTATTDVAQLATWVNQRLAAFNRPVFTFSLHTASIIDCFTNTPISYRKQTPYVLFSGVGNPEQVFVSASECMKTSPQAHGIYRDHHTYTQNDVKELLQHNLPLLCTPKDAVKLLPFASQFHGTPLWVMQPHIVFGPYWNCSKDFPTWWEDCWHNICATK